MRAALGITNSLSSVSKFISDWTPWAMLVTYGTFSFFAFVAMPDEAHSIVWYILALLQTFVTLTVLTEALQSVQPNVQARRQLRKSIRQQDYPELDIRQCPHIDLCIVAYLPNERDIIVQQVKYAAREINYPKNKFTVNVVYNTPHEIQPTESDLEALQRQDKNVRIVKVPNSKSKAANINHFLSLPDTKGDIITVLDTDHFCEPNALRWVAHRFQKGDVDIVQGRCCIYNVEHSFLTRMVAAEFDTIYGVFHPGRASLHGYGLFGGSNGHWSASLLKTLKMDGSMLTEDIDSTLRALTSQARVAYDLKVITYEQAPITTRGLLRQRLRWAQGWTQVTIRHTIPALKLGVHGSFWRSRMGLFFLLSFRELYFHLVLQLFFLIVSSFITNPPHTWDQLYSSFVGFKLSVWMLALNAVAIFVCTCITLRNRSAFVSALDIVVFGFFSPIYFTIVSFMAIFGHFRQFAGYSVWNVTERKRSSV